MDGFKMPSPVLIVLVLFIGNSSMFGAVVLLSLHSNVEPLQSHDRWSA